MLSPEGMRAARGASRRLRRLGERLALLLLAGVGPACALQPSADGPFTVVPRARFQDLALSSSSKVFITSGGQPGTATSIDLRNDLGVDGASAPVVGVDLVWGDRRVRLGLESESFDGHATLGQALVFNGVTFPAGTAASTNLDLTFVTAGYDGLVWHDDDTDLWLGAEAFVWTFDMGMEAPGAGLSASRSFTHALPALTASCTWQCSEDWRLVTEFQGGLLGSDRRIVDLEAGFVTLLGERLNLDIGYRYRDFRFHETTNTGELVAHGPFLAAWMAF